MTTPTIDETTEGTLFSIEEITQTCRHLPRVEPLEVLGRLLQRPRLPVPPGVLAVNLLGGAARAWSFYPAWVGDVTAGAETVTLATGGPERLASELDHASSLPRAVILCPGSDPFLPLRQVQEEMGLVIETIASRGVQVWLMTRGYVRPALMNLLARHASLIRVTIGLTTLDRPLQRQLEPLCASPSLRLRQVGQLRSLGIPVQVALEPLLPGLTDCRDNANALFAAIRAVGVEQVSAGHLFFPVELQQGWRERLEPIGMAEAVLEAYRRGPIIRMPGLGRCQFLPRSRRQKNCATLMALAATHGLRFSVSAWSNPDFTRSTGQ